jgi:hypothetical protein
MLHRLPFLLVLMFLTSAVGAKELRLRGCDFVVDMPGQFIINETKSVHYSYQIAQSMSESDFFQVECLPDKNVTEAMIEHMAFTHAQAIGAYGLQFTRIDSKNFKSRFTKNLLGGVATFEVVMKIGPNSAILATSSTYADRFPSDQILRFQKSVSRK